MSSLAVQDTFPLAIVAEIESVINSVVTFGDTDRDGMNEIISLDRSVMTFNWQPVIVEERGNNTFVFTYPPGITEDLIPYATGDLDRDGKMEIIGQYSSYIQVYESVDGTSFPSALVWQSPSLTNVGGSTAIGDTDADGRMELIHSASGFGGTAGMVIYENTGDNSYSEVFTGSTPRNDATYEKAVADLDGDGRPEIAVCGNNGFLYIFEAYADNAWQVAWTDSTGLHNAYAAEAGWDTDGNGWPELFIMGNHFETDTWDSRVYEAIGDNAYRLVTTLAVPNPNSGQPNDALADLDGDGDGEYMMQAAGHLWIHDAEPQGQWLLIGVVWNPGDRASAYAYDLNRNGRWEIVWRGSPTWVLERPVTSDTSNFTWGSQQLRVVPNPVRLDAEILWPRALTGARTLAVYDGAGQLVSHRQVVGGPFAWSTRGLASGIYFLRLADVKGKVLATGRAAVRH